jgi:hypothetical protein
LQDIQRDGKTFSVPNKDSVTSDDPPELKRRFFDQTYDAIHNGNGKMSTKVAAFASRFTIGSAKLNEAKNRLLPLFNYNSHVITLTHDNIYEFSDTRLQLDTGARMNYNIGAVNPNAEINQATRNNARFFGAILNIKGQNTHPSCTVPDLELQIAFRLPLVNNAVAPYITHATLQDPHALLILIEANIGKPPDIGVLMKYTGQLTAQNDHTKFTEDFQDYYHKCLFLVTTQLIRETFVGAQPPGDAHAALQKCRQVSWDPITRQVTSRTVQQFYDAFTNTLLGMPTDAPYTADIASMFYNNLEQSLQNLLLARRFALPPRAPAETNADAQQRVHVVFVAALALEQETEAVLRRAQVRNFPARPNAGNQNQNSHSFLTSVMDPFAAEALTTNNATEAYHELLDFQGLPIPEDDGTGIGNGNGPHEADEDQLFLVAAIHMSVAEEAIRRATGSPAPPKECWGCTGTRDFHANRFHLFRECPNRTHPDVKQNFTQRLEAFRQNKPPPAASSPYRPSVATTTMDPTTCEADGWPSPEAAAIVATISDPSTPAARRREMVPALYAILDQQIHRADPDSRKRTAKSPPAQTKTADDDDDGEPTSWNHQYGPYYGPTSFYTYMATTSTETAESDDSKPAAKPTPAATNDANDDDDEEPASWNHEYGPYYGANTYSNFMITAPTDNATYDALNHFPAFHTAFQPPQTFTPTLSFSQVLPHVSFPIGPRAENQGLLRCMIDTGASLNVGRTEYHMSIRDKRPELVHYFSKLADIEGMQPFGIGSVNGDGPATTMDAMISYKTPYIVGGRPVTITFALGSSIATNSILSYPFLQSIKGTVMLENMTLVSATLGDSFRIESMVPLRANQAPIIPESAPAAFAIQKSNVRVRTDIQPPRPLLPFAYTPEVVGILQDIPSHWPLPGAIPKPHYEIGKSGRPIVKQPFHPYRTYQRWGNKSYRAYRDETGKEIRLPPEVPITSTSNLTTSVFLLEAAPNQL